MNVLNMFRANPSLIGIVLVSGGLVNKIQVSREFIVPNWVGEISCLIGMLFLLFSLCRFVYRLIQEHRINELKNERFKSETSFEEKKKLLELQEKEFIMSICKTYFHEANKSGESIDYKNFLRIMLNSYDKSKDQNISDA